MMLSDLLILVRALEEAVEKDYNDVSFFEKSLRKTTLNKIHKELKYNTGVIIFHPLDDGVDEKYPF